MTGRMLTLVAMGCLALGPAALEAQAGRGPPAQHPRMELERQLHARFGQMVRNQLSLSREKADSLQEILRFFRDERMAITRAQAPLRMRVRMPALSRLTAGEAREILREMIRLQEEELNLYRREQEELLKVLTPVQLLHFYRLRDDLGQRVQQLRMGRGPG